MAQSRVTTKAVALALGAALASGWLAGCSEDDAAAPTATRTPIGELDTARMKVVRVEFCDLVGKHAIRQALAGGATSASSWKNGDRVPGSKPGDIGHEVGCGWKGKDGRSARAWVFARPVNASFAATLVKAAGEQPGCRVAKGASFGKPSLTQLCAVPKELTRVRYAGLFGDTWLTCEVTGPRPTRDDVKKRAGAWCVNVATTLDTQE